MTIVVLSLLFLWEQVMSSYRAIQREHNLWHSSENAAPLDRLQVDSNAADVA